MLWLCTMARADQWTYFHPELVRKYGCTVSETEVVLNGTSHGEFNWDATAYAERADHTRWEQEVGRFPFTVKGRHQAQKVCSKWQDEAEKRVRKAQ